MTLGVAAVTIAPLDHLSFRLQHLDHQGGSCLELVDRSDGSPLLECQRAHWGLVNSWYANAESSQLASLCWYFDDATHVQTIGMQACVGLAASVWVRLELQYLMFCKAIRIMNPSSRAHCGCEVSVVVLEVW